MDENPSISVTQRYIIKHRPSPLSPNRPNSFISLALDEYGSPRDIEYDNGASDDESFRHNYAYSSSELLDDDLYADNSYSDSKDSSMRPGKRTALKNSTSKKISPLARHMAKDCETFSYPSYTTSESGDYSDSHSDFSESSCTSTTTTTNQRSIDTMSSSDADPFSFLDSFGSSSTGTSRDGSDSSLVFVWGQWVLKRMNQKIQKLRANGVDNEDDSINDGEKLGFHLDFDPVDVDSDISSCSSCSSYQSLSSLIEPGLHLGGRNDVPTRATVKNSPRDRPPKPIRSRPNIKMIRIPAVEYPSSRNVKGKKLIGRLCNLRGRSGIGSSSSCMKNLTQSGTSRRRSNETDTPSSSSYSASEEHAPILLATTTSSSSHYVNSSINGRYRPPPSHIRAPSSLSPSNKSMKPMGCMSFLVGSKEKYLSKQAKSAVRHP